MLCKVNEEIRSISLNSLILSVCTKLSDFIAKWLKLHWNSLLTKSKQWQCLWLLGIRVWSCKFQLGIRCWFDASTMILLHILNIFSAFAIAQVCCGWLQAESDDWIWIKFAEITKSMIYFKLVQMIFQTQRSDAVSMIGEFEAFAVLWYSRKLIDCN